MKVKVSDLFIIETGKDLVYGGLNNGVYDVVGHSARNNGVVATTTPLKGYKLYKANSCITVGHIGNFYATVQPRDFYIGTRTKALIPKKPMSLNVLIYYAICLNKNKDKFSYGRVGSSRIPDILVPSLEDVPMWIGAAKIKDYSDIVDKKENDSVKLPSTNTWKLFTYEDLFDIKKGRGPSATAAKKSPGTVPYIGASAQNNGVTHHSSHKAENEGNCLTIATDGSVGECFYQPKDFNATSNIACLKLKNAKLNPQVALFLATLIKKERFKFNYGRKWNLDRMKTSTIKVPVDENGNIDTELITKYMNSLSYSKYL